MVNRVLMAIEALEGGCSREQVEVLTGLSLATIERLDIASMGECAGADLRFGMSMSDMAAFVEGSI